MTKSIQELFDYIASLNFNPEMFKRALKEHKDLDVNLHVGSTKSTLLGHAAHALNAAAVKILLNDFHAAPDALTKGEGAQVWTPVYWAAYNADKSTAVDIAKRLEILDLLYDAGATMMWLYYSGQYVKSKYI